MDSVPLVANIRRLGFILLQFVLLAGVLSELQGISHPRLEENISRLSPSLVDCVCFGPSLILMSCAVF